MAQQRYNDLNVLLSAHFDGKMQKISLHAGFTCPNRDGTKGTGGCTYCNNQTFSPEYCMSRETITNQLKKGAHFFSRKYPAMRFLAYFQSYTNTYADLNVLIDKYEEALRFDRVEGLIIGTRPDCMSKALLDYLEDLARRKFVLVEFGVESTNDNTLKYINRGHSYKDTEDAIQRTVSRGIMAGAHLILGLPGETKDDILTHSRRISRLPLTTVKLHQLQLIKGTKMVEQQKENPHLFYFYSIDEYIELVIDFVELLHPNFIVERFVSQSPKELLIYPDWGLKNNEITVKIIRRMNERDTWQGKQYADLKMC